ncbi:glycoprotein 3-alpha-L-fucosyltransferase A [Nephila pilipes]|uniref:Fucosyltransferase n=1 Tax=Nephila pilipes TaxID=299642 RepID=A0A8X6PB60_NEPPI|nr:glycoprotein 3-alpha-L-fucosyltransferase A [Nephila pilipes]
MSEKISILNLTPCEEPYFQEWKEEYVNGQVRTVRIKINKTKESSGPSKTILLWTTYFGQVYSNDFYFFQEGRKTFDRYNCEVSNCYVTTNKSMLPYTDAVLFHVQELGSSNIPSRFRDDQIWIIYGMEPPKYAILKWHLISSLFNWTMTYRSDSDIQVKYGEVVRRNKSCSKNGYKHKNFAKNKKHAAVWMVSNCRTESRREIYVKELRKYFKVDVYGRCSRSRKCEPSQSESCYKLLKDYKYYLSFENSICKDYITEKFFNALHYNIVPVVFGAANYKAIAPPNSYIDATHFSNPKLLANQLRVIAENSTWYNSLFDWKNNYSVHLHPWMCDLCERLHQEQPKVKTVPKDLWSWWVPNASCQRWSKKAGFQTIFPASMKRVSRVL